MEIMEIAKQLGQAIKKDERITRLNDARKAYEEDEEVNRLTLEYNVHQTALREEYGKDDRDMEAIKSIQTRIEEIYNAIVSNASYVAFNVAQEEVNKFMNEVNEEITFQITGERPCTHDCSTCGGSCGHNH